VATKMGFVDMVVVVVCGVKAVLIFQDLPAFSLMCSVVIVVKRVERRR
jgi:hypothetical protein